MTKRADLETRLSYALAWVHGKSDLAPAVGVILGSGLAGLADRLERPVAMPYEEIPYFPISRVAGHPGRLVVGELRQDDVTVPLVVMQGRAHGYEGWSAEDVAFGARVLCRLGVKALLVTNAAGGVNPSFGPGDLVRIVDHLNLSGQNPLRGPNDDRLGPRFPDMSEAYDRRLGALLDDAAAEAGVELKRGVYACLAGPSYETPAEVRMLRGIGADLVGMSTVPEVIAARHMGVPVAGLSIVTNLAAGLARKPLSHEEVAETAERARDRLSSVVGGFLARATR
jgi:purine-nucleoside phosphorylase